MKTAMPGDIFETGQVLNNTYEILGVLGRGGTGEVYLARNQVVDRKVAIKALNSQFSGNDDYLDLMKREEEMSDIIHDAIVRYSECSRSDQGHVFLVMEFVDGVSLNDLMMDRRLDDKELLIIAHRVLQGLVQVHAHGIVHRDLSPDNIILRDGAPERATIIDFGIAKDTTAGARTIVGNDFAGKYEYAAPEQLDGHSEFRTDLYALGASLLAAHKRDIPYLGSTPGEIMRRKQDPLDTEDIRAPLKDLIDWLAAPDLNNRPLSAEAALDRMNQSYLKAPNGNDAVAPKRKLIWLSVPVAAGFTVMGLWFSGVFDALLPRSLPNAAPYTLSAGFDQDGESHLLGYAPDTETQTALQQTLAAAIGEVPDKNAIEFATGMPTAEWPAQIQALFEIAGGLDDWDFDISDNQATLKGLAANVEIRNSLVTQLENWSFGSGISLQTDLTAGPRILDGQVIASELGKLSTCGPLIQNGMPDDGYALNSTLAISGHLAEQSDAARIQSALKRFVGDRKIRLDTITLNADLCAIRQVLPAAPSANLSIWLGDGETEQQVITGVFQTGQNPVVDINMPATITEGSLWVLIVDNTGKVFHVLPNVNRKTHDVAQLGTVENGLRRVRVLFSADEFRQDTNRLAMRINQGDYGKSEIIAILSKRPLFDGRRPRDESVTSVAEALGSALLNGRDGIIGVAARIIEARP
ncbi:MAG: serine/threonine-protein kinase [Litoreibacter sp.]